MAGDWDLNTELFEEIFPLDAFYERYQEDAPWEQTSMIPFLEEMFESGQSWGGYTSFPEAWDRLDQIDELYCSIQEDGYQTQTDLMDTEAPIGIPKWAANSPTSHEVAISIGRNGELIFEDGRHRLAIAKVLELESIPVQVVLRHANWVEKLRSSTADSAVIGHPDELSCHQKE